MESTGEAGRIQVSVETGELLIKAGHKLMLREKEVSVKGKGMLQTYWLDFPAGRATASHSVSRLDAHEWEATDPLAEQTIRLVEWNANNLVQLLREKLRPGEVH